MTPEPDGGFYGNKGAKEFVEKYGHHSTAKDMYFTGIHRVGQTCEATGMTLVINGYDSNDPASMKVSGSIILADANNNEAASWSFTQLLEHWNRKHAFAAYVKYTARKNPFSYRYESPVLMGEQTNFTMYLDALCSGHIVFDPGSKVTKARTAQSKIKARSQFRIQIGQLSRLYKKLSAESLMNQTPDSQN